jgi:hypothetical protein
MYDALMVGVVQCEDNLDSEAPHDRVRNQAVLEPSAETPQRFTHEGKDEAYVPAIRTLVLKVIQ